MWGYLFLYGAPKKPREVFSNLGFFPTQETGEVRTVTGTTPIPKDATRLSLSNGKLEQITTRAVAGFTFLEDAPEVLRYVERGTGHMFEIDFTAGLERQVSLTTIPQIVAATFSQNGERVALTSNEGYVTKTSVGTLIDGDDSLRLITLRDGAEDIHFTDRTTVTYTVTNTQKTVGYSRNLDTLTEKVLFEVPLPDATTVWTGEVGTVHPRPTKYFEGALYKVNGSSLAPLTDSFLGLSGFMVNETPVYSYVEGSTYRGGAKTGSGHTEQGIILIKEKCVVDTETQNELICAAPLTATADFIESWYKGTLRSEDFLWRTDLETGSAELIEDLEELAGRAIDVDSITANKTSSRLLLRNKIDDTLWIYQVKE
jgi:hypothetical protein